MDQELYGVRRAVEVVKDPTTYSWLTYLWVCALSAWGGVIRYLSTIKDKKIPVRQILFDIFLSTSTSAFVGIITFYFCEAADFEPLWTAVCVAVTGHMGAEGLAVFRRIVQSKLNP